MKPIFICFLSILLFGGCCSQKPGIQWVPCGPLVVEPMEKPSIKIKKEDALYFYYKSSGKSHTSFSDAQKVAQRNLKSAVVSSIYQEAYLKVAKSSIVGKSTIPVSGAQVNEVIRGLEPTYAVGMSGVLIFDDFEQKTTQLQCHVCNKKLENNWATYEVTLLARYSKKDFIRTLLQIINNKSEIKKK